MVRTLLKTPYMAASKLGNNFTEHETAIHTSSQCSHNHFLQLQHKSTPALHRISYRFFPCVSHSVDLELGRLGRLLLYRPRVVTTAVLTNLDLFNNSIGDEGAIAIALPR